MKVVVQDKGRYSARLVVRIKVDVQREYCRNEDYLLFRTKVAVLQREYCAGFPIGQNKGRYSAGLLARMKVDIQRKVCGVVRDEARVERFSAQIKIIILPCHTIKSQPHS